MSTTTSLFHCWRHWAASSHAYTYNSRHQLDHEDLSCAYLAHHELESVLIIIIIIIVVVIIIIIIIVIIIIIIITIIIIIIIIIMIMIIIN